MPNVGGRRILLLGTENADGTVTGVTSGTSQPILADGRGYASIFFRSIGTTSGGTILIEEADWGSFEAPYSGTWSTLYTQAASGVTGTVQLAVHVSPTAYGWYRARISSAITGGGTVLISARDLGVS